MEKKKPDLVAIIMFIVAIFTIFLQIYPPQTARDQTNSIIYFLAILGYLTFLYVISSVLNKVKLYINKINSNEEQIKKINNRMNEEKRFNKIETRISILEALKKNKKGFGLDPRWIFLIILLVLFYLYLRSLGFFG